MRTLTYSVMATQVPLKDLFLVRIQIGQQTLLNLKIWLQR